VVFAARVRCVGSVLRDQGELEGWVAWLDADSCVQAVVPDDEIVVPVVAGVASEPALEFVARCVFVGPAHHDMHSRFESGFAQVERAVLASWAHEVELELFFIDTLFESNDHCAFGDEFLVEKDDAGLGQGDRFSDPVAGVVDVVVAIFDASNMQDSDDLVSIRHADEEEVAVFELGAARPELVVLIDEEVVEPHGLGALDGWFGQKD
jgi:hypothetical protein